MIEGNQYQFDFWYIDNVTVQAEQPSNSYFVSLAANPENGGTVSGEGLYTVGENVSILATPSPNYFFIEWQVEDGTSISNANPFVFQMPTEDINYTAIFNHCSEYPAPFNLGAIQLPGTYEAELTWQKPTLGPDFPQIINSSVFLNGNLIASTMILL